jgi:protein-tyrosine phosphatase
VAAVEATDTPHRNPFPTLYNFRDVGGLTGQDGRLVRRGRLYRSDSLHRITETDQAAFTALGIRTVIDLRRPSEVSRDGRVPAYDGLVYRNIHPEHQNWDQVPYDPDEDMARWLADRYAALAETGTAGVAEAVGLIADSADAPVVVHCVAGKDRTGIVCGLTLSVLGVADADIAADYALTTEASARFNAWFTAAHPDVGPLPPAYLASPAEAMHLFLTELREGYGSVEGYLRQAGVTAAQLDALRTHLLS